MSARLSVMPRGWGQPLGQGGVPPTGGRYRHPHHSTQQLRPQHYMVGSADATGGLCLAGGTIPGSVGPPQFSTLHQLSSSSAATPSPSSSSSSTPSSARLASRGLGPRMGASLSCRGSSIQGKSGVSSGCRSLARIVCRGWDLGQEDQSGSQDCSDLSPLNEEAMLHNLVTRFKRDQIYVSINN